MFIVQMRVRKTIYNGVGLPYTWRTVEGFKYRTYESAIKGAERMGIQQYLGETVRIKKEA